MLPPEFAKDRERSRKFFAGAREGPIPVVEGEISRERATDLGRSK